MSAALLVLGGAVVGAIVAAVAMFFWVASIMPRMWR